MIIDAHNHPNWLGHNYDNVIKNMDECSIDKMWLLSWECPESEYDPEQRNLLNDGCGMGQVGPIPFCDCVAYKNKNASRFVLGFAPDLRDPASLDRLCAAMSLHGVKIFGEVKLRTTYDNPDAIRLFKFCGQNKLPVVLHFDYPISTTSKYPRPNWWYGGYMGNLENMLKRCPDTNFLGHAPGFWANISNDDKKYQSSYPTGEIVRDGKIVTLARQYNNLYFDLSGRSGRNALERDPSHAKEFFDEFQDRILYARDSFDNKLKEFIDGLNLSSTISDKVFYKNAEILIKD